MRLLQFWETEGEGLADKAPKAAQSSSIVVQIGGPPSGALRRVLGQALEMFTQSRTTLTLGEFPRHGEYVGSCRGWELCGATADSASTCNPRGHVSKRQRQRQNRATKRGGMEGGG